MGNHILCILNPAHILTSYAVWTTSIPATQNKVFLAHVDIGAGDSIASGILLNGIIIINRVFKGKWNHVDNLHSPWNYVISILVLLIRYFSNLYRGNTTSKETRLCSIPLGPYYSHLSFFSKNNSHVNEAFNSYLNMSEWGAADGVWSSTFLA